MLRLGEFENRIIPHETKELVSRFLIEKNLSCRNCRGCRFKIIGVTKDR